ncbi:CaiB/BaiF CoA transferase family protein [Chelatococcus reniformis]|uniref:Alpha-methylacyl-CoA racemase n=1 Tax=Chelatococcus reniformis TaxID=1494448 RepID=A0A916X9H3_9HYPH|nr:CaiB/BaiF CoA-transferase family protein [Chelatococcus reniformis]GGC57034.1 alpha-methylacyl-CoA racemase [Chelatococcus reniformis]
MAGTSGAATGPLKGIRVIEFAGIGPGPFAAGMLGDMGADVIRLDRKGSTFTAQKFAGRGRRVVDVDLKDKGSIDAVLELLASADALIEGFRPGVMERLGLGPDVVLARNPRLVYGRMTGWGQEGPLALAAGHDINYISITGALAAMGPAAGPPMPPLNLVGDFGGGALYLVVGVLAGIVEAQRTGKGQVVDAAMCDGAVSLMQMFYEMSAAGRWNERREANLLDGGAHFYGAFECADGQFVSIGSIEPQFYALLRQIAGLEDADFDAQLDQSKWPALREKIAKVFKTKTRAEWCKLMEGTDVCFGPVLTMSEAMTYPHLTERGTFVEVNGVTQPAPAPRFSRTPSSIRPVETAALGDVVSEWSRAKTAAE